MWILTYISTGDRRQHADKGRESRPSLPRVAILARLGEVECSDEGSGFFLEG